MRDGCAHAKTNRRLGVDRNGWFVRIPRDGKLKSGDYREQFADRTRLLSRRAWGFRILRVGLGRNVRMATASTTTGMRRRMWLRMLNTAQRMEPVARHMKCKESEEGNCT